MVVTESEHKSVEACSVSHSRHLLEGTILVVVACVGLAKATEMNEQRGVRLRVNNGPALLLFCRSSGRVSANDDRASKRAAVAKAGADAAAA